MTPTEARAILAASGLTQSDLARRMIALGDTRPFETVLRAVQLHMAIDKPRVPPMFAWGLREMSSQTPRDVDG
jgi:hypothetical protein